MMKNLLLLVLCASALTAVVECAKVVGCYYGSWALYRQSIGRFSTENIDPSLCTHVYYCFLGLNRNTQEIEVFDSNVDLDRGGYRNFTGFKARYPNVKFSIAIGGWNQGSYAFSALCQNATKRARFIQQIIEFIKTYKFDGLELDWEYPTQRDSAYGAADKDNFMLLLKEIKQAFEPLGLLITVAVGSSPSYIGSAYDVPALSKVVDLINFMTYDIHGSWDGVAGINAPLYDPAGSTSVEAFVNSWLDAGVDPKKLIVGIPFYGKSYTLANASNNAIGAPITGGGEPGPYLLDSSNLVYYEILEKLQQGWTEVYDKNYQSPYAYSGNQWVGYDNVRSVLAKVRFACSKGLGGVMNWAIDEDDFGGYFGRKYPLLKAMNVMKRCRK
ncbi:endochitinase-like [Agrilus planipennis]|uniref:Endochitinase-like n=1 Tax=Agrilus planipennis TaxID=224129 RepID=A0A1W4WRR1_AGRPL|nr:endochitinase-like [Agrilus planipennis]